MAINIQSRLRVKLALLSIALGVGLICAELVLRLVWVPVVVINTETRGPHPDYGFAPLAGATGVFARTEYATPFSHTAQRLRGDTLLKAERSPATRARVMFLGDSFTYSITTSPEDGFVGRLAARWPDVEMINTGCSGYGPREELAVLDKLGAVMKPDITVLTFFWNDVEDILRQEPTYAVDDEGKVCRTVPPDAPSDPLKLWPTTPTAGRSKWATYYSYEILRELTVGARHRHTNLARPQQIQTPEAADEAWKLIDDQYRLIKLRADELGTRLIVAHIPDYSLINPASTVATVKPFSIEVQARIADVCKRHSIELFDALPHVKSAFTAAGGAAGMKKTPFYFETDRHLTVEGNRVISEYFANVLGPLLPSAKSSAVR